eukprot:5229569-Pleurochrysis_carterae.AAC.1
MPFKAALRHWQPSCSRISRSSFSSLCSGSPRAPSHASTARRLEIWCSVISHGGKILGDADRSRQIINADDDQ